MYVGILTFHNTTNFGATLQCTALARTIAESGHRVEVINYTPLGPYLKYLKWMFLSKNGSIRNIGKILKFKKFQRQNYSLSGRPMFTHRSLRKLCGKKYDCVVIGSDEVWKTNHLRKFDPAYFGSFVDKEFCRVISYAISSSSESTLKDNRNLTARLLKNMHAISVRDKKTYREVFEITNIIAEITLDPTLLARHEYKDASKPDSEYIAVYANLDSTESQILRDFADENKMRVVGIGVKNLTFDQSLVSIGPEEWKAAIRNSSMVVTNFFHGIIFALLFDRPLFCYVDPLKREKLENILEITNLSHILYSSPRQLKGKSLEEFVYPEGRLACIENQITTSRRFLERELSIYRKKPDLA